MSQSKWHKVADLDAIPEKTIFPVAAGGGEWIILRDGSELRAYRDLCSHQDVKLSEFGHIDGDTLVCFAHGACFACEDGAALTWPAVESLEKAAVKVVGGEVFLSDLSSSVP